jgi:hypothetical protein
MNKVLLQKNEESKTNPPATSFPKEVIPPKDQKQNYVEDTISLEKMSEISIEGGVEQTNTTYHPHKYPRK